MKLVGFRAVLRTTQRRAPERFVVTVMIALSIAIVLPIGTILTWGVSILSFFVIDYFLVGRLLFSPAKGFRRRARAYLLFETALFTVFNALMIPLWFTDAEGARAFAVLLMVGGTLYNAQYMIYARALTLLILFQLVVFMVLLPMAAFLWRGDMIGLVTSWSSAVCLVYVRKIIRDAHGIARMMRRLLAEAKAAQIEAERANAAKSTFLATISHEIRTPLNAVLATTRLLEKSRLDDAQRRHVFVLDVASTTLTDLLNDVLDISRIEADKLTLDQEDADLRACLLETEALWRPKAEMAGIAFSLDIDGLRPGWAHCDVKRLRQIIFNLLSNALKFTEAGKVELRAAWRDGDLLVEVEDTGMGVAPADIDGIFRSFEQTHDGATRGGSGLGLAISRRLAEMMGGALTAESELGRGSIFRLRVPLRSIGEEGKTVSAAGEPARLDDVSGIRALCADDNDLNREVLRGLLGLLGVEPVFAHDGREAVEMASVERYDVLLLDMQMPRLSGIDAAREIRAGDGPNRVTPIIAVTANAFDEHRRKWSEAGAEGFLGKPVTPEQLARAIAEARRGAALALEA